ncbi:hypothetical protein C1J03_03645 [Sulfitobacter sp. SK012]|uniref:hypothetical protein n=1 Tax=Sulfitobacter sp. SK012 TaxID=1389005 RepID=UPI000E0C7FE3|nr:hypothetical protein [Sulfitobacter sp. SK012]AXI45211.1 hypothetical protein C1J03_03645 [Sulfitobacter sp. SK012]
MKDHKTSVADLVGRDQTGLKATGDVVTILECHEHMKQCKSFETGPAGIVLIQNYDLTKNYRTTQAAFADISDLFQILKTVSACDRKAIIRGEPTFDIRETGYRPKTKNPQPVRVKGIPALNADRNLVTEPPTYKDAPRRWHVIDADNIGSEFWQGLDLIQDAERIARRFRAGLPEWLRGTAMIVQLSSSHGVEHYVVPTDPDGNVGEPELKTAKPKLHLFYLTDRALTADQGDLLAKEIGTDPAPARTVQHVYTATPAFFDTKNNSVADPLGRERWFLLDGDAHATLPGPSAAMWEHKSGIGGGKRHFRTFTSTGLTKF